MHFNYRDSRLIRDYTFYVIKTGANRWQVTGINNDTHEVKTGEISEYDVCRMHDGADWRCLLTKDYSWWCLMAADSFCQIYYGWNIAMKPGYIFGITMKD